MTDRVTDHAERFFRGDTPSGDLHRLACKRHIDDLNESGSEFYFDENEAAKVLKFAEKLTVAEGERPAPVILLPEQAFDIGATFGWKRKDNGKRRFRRRYKCMAKQNGKTFENGIMGTYIAAFGGYNYGRLFTAATKKRQARAAWDEIAKFIRADPELAEYFKIKEYAAVIECLTNGCKLEALSREGGLEHGFRSIFASIDEIHQHRDNRIYKTLYDGTRALAETLVSMITTRGERLNSFCKEMDDYCVNILRGLAKADDFFVDIYALNDGDDIWNADNWFKSNPFIASKPELFRVLQADAETARDMGGSDQRDFMTMSLNLWVERAEDIFIDPTAWKECGSERALEAFKDQTCYVGLDLSSGGDLTTLSLEFDKPDGGVYIWSHSYMPRGRFEEHIITDTAPYDLWERDGLITVTGGEMDFKNDYKFILSDLAELQKRYGLKFAGIGLDPHNADGILADLEAFGCPVVLITQSARSLNDATEDLRLLVKSRKVEYDRRNELLTWSFLNASLTRNSFDEVKIDKHGHKGTSRVDPVDAAVDAHALKLLSQKNDTQPDPCKEMEDYLKLMGWK